LSVAEAAITWAQVTLQSVVVELVPKLAGI